MAEHDGPGGCVPWERFDSLQAAYNKILARTLRLEAAISGHREMKKAGDLSEADDQYLYAILDERSSNRGSRV